MRRRVTFGRQLVVGERIGRGRRIRRRMLVVIRVVMIERRGGRRRRRLYGVGGERIGQLYVVDRVDQIERRYRLLIVAGYNLEMQRKINLKNVQCIKTSENFQ